MKVDYKTLSREERLKRFDELTYAAEHGILNVGWPTKRWGMITSFSRIHRLYELIMQRKVWTHEMGTKGLANMRLELEDKKQWEGPIGSLVEILEASEIEET
ncbi:MAG: hypothetical protein ACYCQJ_16135 [Nitrososphaerales archaeon]